MNFNPFAVGDLVVCVNKANHAWFLRLGGIYKIDQITPSGRVCLAGMAKAWDPAQFRHLLLDDRVCWDTRQVLRGFQRDTFPDRSDQ